MLWNDNREQDFDTQKRLIEEVFAREGVLSVLEGSVPVKYASEHPSPLFQYALSGYRQSGLMPAQSVPRDELLVIDDVMEYNNHLDEFKDQYDAWMGVRKAHEAVIR